jgi:hypothetical protein
MDVIINFILVVIAVHLFTENKALKRQIDFLRSEILVYRTKDVTE